MDVLINFEQRWIKQAGVQHRLRLVDRGRLEEDIKRYQQSAGGQEEGKGVYEEGKGVYEEGRGVYEEGGKGEQEQGKGNVHSVVHVGKHDGVGKGTTHGVYDKEDGVWSVQVFRSIDSNSAHGLPSDNATAYKRGIRTSMCAMCSVKCDSGGVGDEEEGAHGETFLLTMHVDR